MLHQPTASAVGLIATPAHSFRAHRRESSVGIPRPGVVYAQWVAAHASAWSLRRLPINLAPTVPRRCYRTRADAHPSHKQRLCDRDPTAQAVG